MIKRFIVGMIVALLILGGYDAIKHKIALYQLSHIPGLHMGGSSLRFNKKGAYLKMRDVSYYGAHLKNVRLHVPFLSYTRLYAWGDTLEYHQFSSKNVKIIGVIKDKVVIDYFYCKDNRLRVFDGMFTNRDIVGNASFSNKKCDFSFHGTMVNEGPHDLFTFTCYGALDQPSLDIRKGNIQIKVSHVENLLNLVMRGDTNPLKAWQRDLFLQTFGDNVTIPLDIRGTKIYLGPLKICDWNQLSLNSLN